VTRGFLWIHRLRAALLCCGAAIGLLALDSGCDRLAPPGEEIGIQFSAPLPGRVSGPRGRRRIQRLDARASAELQRLARRPSGPAPSAEKVAAELRHRTVARTGALDTVVVLLRDYGPIPPLILICMNAPPIRARGHTFTDLVDTLALSRKSALDDWLARQPAAWQVTRVEDAWLIPASLVSVLASAAESLATDTTVLAVEPRFRRVALPDACGGTPGSGTSRPPCPPSQTHPLPTSAGGGVVSPAVAADQTVLPPYLALPGRPTRIAVLDTGADADHVLLQAGSNLSSCADCTSNPLGCVPSTTDLLEASGGHGTETSGFLAANCYYGEHFRGQNRAPVDMFRIYRPPVGVPCDGDVTADSEFDLTAAIRAVQAAVRRCDQTIVFETQVRCPETSILDALAEAAFAVGAVVIAANGNNTAQAVGAPARAPGVIGVGYYNTAVPQSGPAFHSRGRIHGRFKPEVIAPSNYTSAKASAGPASADFQPFTKTSGATPVGAAVAAELLRWMRGGWTYPWMKRPVIPPGQVYAQLILAGDTPYSSTAGGGQGFDEALGGGYLRMHTDGMGSWGSVVVAAGDPPLQIPVPAAGAGATQVDAALWWHDDSEPDDATQPYGGRSAFSLSIVPPTSSGIAHGESNAVGGTFQRARAGSLAPGATRVQGWVIEIATTAVPAGSRVVYWAAAAR
jgi:hypothetical protein